MNYQSLNESIRSVTNPKVFKTSPQEDEFLTDLTRAQIAAIKPLMKSKNWNKLKAYLMSQKIVDKDFNDITKYKMDRDILSVLQRSFSTYHEQVENESFSSLVEEQRYIEEYIELLESALESIAEELELDPNELVEAYRLTPARSAVLDRAEKGAKRKITHSDNEKAKESEYGSFSSSQNDKREAESRIKRIKNLRTMGSGAPNRKGVATKLRKQHHTDRGYELHGKSHLASLTGRRGPTRKQMNWAQRKTG